MPGLSIQVGPSNGSGPAPLVELIVFLTLLSFGPALLLMLTSFVRMVIVLSLLRNALGVPTVPPNIVVTGLALLLTLFVMAPTIEQVNAQALRPYVEGRLGPQAALAAAERPVRAFLLRQTREEDIALFVRLGRLPRPRTPHDVPLYALVPAFVTSELRTAFTLGAVVFLPFVAIDLVVSSTLLGLGMFMLPPTVISLPLKLLLFVLANGWTLTVSGLVGSVR